MNIKHTAIVLGGSFVALFAAAGCSVSTNDPAPATTVVTTSPTDPDSTLTVRWSIDGLTDPNECVKSVSQNIEITVFDDAGGAQVGTFQQDCTAFETSISLPAGSYGASAVLIDGAGQVRTTDVGISPFTLRGDELVVTVDFPADSFR